MYSLLAELYGWHDEIVNEMTIPVASMYLERASGKGKKSSGVKMPYAAWKKMYGRSD